MVSFAFNTMIGQVTPIAMARIGWRFYILFVVCNFTNAVYFWATQPESKIYEPTTLLDIGHSLIYAL